MRKRNGMTNGEASRNCQEVISRLFKECNVDKNSYDASFQGKNYTLYFDNGKCDIFPSPSKPAIQLKLLNKIWGKVKPPVMNQV